MVLKKYQNQKGFKMPGQIRKNHSDKFKFKVALEALLGQKTASELSQEFGVAPSQIYTWKKQLEEHGSEVFADKRKADGKETEIEKLHSVIGKLTVENNFLSKVLGR